MKKREGGSEITTPTLKKSKNKAETEEESKAEGSTSTYVHIDKEAESSYMTSVEIEHKKKQGAASPPPSKTISVQSILRNPTKSLIDYDQVSFYSPSLRSRIETLSNYINKSANVYSLGNILPTATWGKYNPLNDRSKELCNPVTNEPIIVWITGHVTSLWFEKNGFAEKQASISVIPLADTLRIQMLKLLAGLSIPRESSADVFGTALRATKWQTAKNSNEPILFSSVYDARDMLKPKLQMETLSPLQLQKNDLILLETKIVHYRLKDPQTGQWGQRAQLEMLAINLIHRPVVKTEEEDYEEGYIKDLCI